MLPGPRPPSPQCPRPASPALARRKFPLDTVLAACVLIVVWLTLLPRWFWGAASINDVPLYLGYAQKMHAGLAPYSDFGLEYPPLSAGVFLAAAATGLEWPRYSAAFGILMLIFALVCLVAVDLIARSAGMNDTRRQWALAIVAIAPLMLGSVFRTRFDLVPTAMAAVALLLAMRDRWLAAFALVGVGAMTKVFPIVLAPLFVAYLLGRRRPADAAMGAVVAVAVIALISLAPLLISPEGYADSYAFQLERPVQIESTPAAVLFAADGLGVGPLEVTGTIANPDRFKSQGVVSPAAGAVSTVTDIVAAAAVIAILWLAYRIGRTRPEDRTGLLLATLGLLLTMLALGPVLSPQFLIWLVPFVAIAAGAGFLWIAVPIGVAWVLTLIEFPAHYALLVQEVPWVVALVASRDLMLVVALVATLVHLRSRLRGPAPSLTPPGPVPVSAGSIAPGHVRPPPR